MAEKHKTLKDLAIVIRQNLKEKMGQEHPFICSYYLEDNEYIYVSLVSSISQEETYKGLPGILLEIKDGGNDDEDFAKPPKASKEIPFSWLDEADWEEKCANALLLLRFRFRYDDQWDYSHQVLNREMSFAFFLRDTGKTYKGPHPIHIKDVPEEMREEYMQYLKQELADLWVISVEEVEKTYALEDAVEESKDGLFELLW